MRILMIIVMLSSASAYAGSGEHKAPVVPQEFKQIQALAGTWEGITKMGGDKEQKVKVTYEVTSGGSAVIERLFVGTPHEMTSVYYPEGQEIKMTHYCMLGNHPTMQLKSSNKNAIAFELDGTRGLKSKDEHHMHALTLTFPSDKEMVQVWTSYQNGKPQETTAIQLTKTQ